MTAYTIPNGDRAMAFEGQLLASASSDDGKAQRWTEFELYRTSAGQFVLHKVGRSAVYHAPDSTCTRSATRKEVSEVEGDDLIPCVRCGVPLIMDLCGPGAVILVETDRHSVVVSESARGIVASMYGKDGNGTKFLTNVAERLMQAAARKDTDIRAAWAVETL